MSTTSGGLPLMAQTQPQRYVTFNESEFVINALHTGVSSRTTTTPPSAVGSTDAYIVPPSGATGAWVGHDDELAYAFGDVWNFLPAVIASGLPILVVDDGNYVRWDGAAYEVVAFAGALEFTDLADVPATYAAQSLKALRVNAAETGIEFFSITGFTGPVSSTDNAVTRWDGNGGATTQDSGVIIDDSNNVSGVVALSATTIELGHASDTTLARSSAGNVSVEGNLIYRAGGTDVPVADGGTGVSTLTAYAPIFGGTTGTGAVQSGTVGTATHVLTSNGPGALPTFQAIGSYLPTTYLDTDGTLAANSDVKIASQKAVKTYVDTAVTGLLDFKGSTNASANPNYPAASKGDAYVVSTAGKIGGASGKSVDVGDVYLAIADNAGGTEASVGTNWIVLEHNLVGALLSANNLSDLASAPTALTNLGGTTVGKAVFILTNPSAITFLKINSDNSVVAESAATYRTSLAAAGRLTLINSRVADYTLALTDYVDTVVGMNIGVANILTVPPNSTVAFPVGASIPVFQQGGGQTTITPGAGVTILSAGSRYKTATQASGATLWQYAADSWLLTGDLTT